MTPTGMQIGRLLRCRHFHSGTFYDKAREMYDLWPTRLVEERAGELEGLLNRLRRRDLSVLTPQHRALLQQGSVEWALKLAAARAILKQRREERDARRRRWTIAAGIGIW